MKEAKDGLDKTKDELDKTKDDTSEETKDELDKTKDDTSEKSHILMVSIKMVFIKILIEDMILMV